MIREHTYIQYVGQGIAFLLFIAFLGILSDYPTYSHTTEDQSTLKLTLNHAGKLIEECRKRSEEELSEMPPNMRTQMDCPRERSSILLEVRLDGQEIYRETLLPFGFNRDGEASTYSRFTLSSGEYRLEVKMKDDANSEDFNYYFDQRIRLVPSEVKVIRFNTLLDKFVII